MNDNYSHDDLDIIYITENIPGPAENTLEYEILLSNFNSMMLENCLCKKICVKMLCKCLQISHGDNYERYICDGELQYKLNHKSKVFRDYPIVECNSNCSCPATCGNRIVQNGPMDGLIVKPCEDSLKGMGLFTPHFIPKGTFICEYAGELLTRTQALLRLEENEAQGKMNYVFCVIEHTHEGIIETYVDPSKFGNIGRYINHSCEPNSCIVPVRSETAIPHLAIFACTDIQEDEEITFNYGSGSKSATDNNTDRKRKVCVCKSTSCEGFMPCENF